MLSEEDKTYLWDLAQKWISGTITPEEKAIFIQWYDSFDDELLAITNEKELHRTKQSILEKVKERIAADKHRHIPKIKHRRVYIAAASFILLLGFGIYLYSIYYKQQLAVSIVTSNDISAPATNRAMISLADGSQVFLDSVKNGQLAVQGNTALVKLANGKIAYQAANGQAEKEPQYNTLVNPRGSNVIDMLLSDGSHVWLNAGSSITYPVTFVRGERKVELKGEGYFEVAKDASRKFIVLANGTETEVLGTHFNVNAYYDDPETKITLLEGAVRLSMLNQEVKLKLKPGQQAIAADAKLSLQPTANIEAVMAWKNGLFNFENATLPEILKQIERWYDVDVVFKGTLPDVALAGKITKGVSLKALVTALKKMGLNCHLENRNLIIEN